MLHHAHEVVIFKGLGLSHPYSIITIIYIVENLAHDGRHVKAQPVVSGAHRNVVQLSDLQKL
jgi:hypothetical protein